MDRDYTLPSKRSTLKRLLYFKDVVQGERAALPLVERETDSFLLSEDESLVSPPLPSLPPLPSVLEEFVDETEVQPMPNIMTEEDKVEQCGEDMLTPSQERLAVHSSEILSTPSQESLSTPSTECLSTPSAECLSIPSPEDQPFEIQHLSELPLPIELQTSPNTSTINHLRRKTTIQAESLFSSVFQKTKAFIASLFHPFSFSFCACWNKQDKQQRVLHAVKMI